MSVREFIAWQGYFRIEPWESEKADLRAAVGAWTTASAMSSSKGRKPKLDDFVPKWDRGERRRRTPEQLRAELEARFRAAGVKFREVKPDGRAEDDSGPGR